jgi:hypothetical protein
MKTIKADDRGRLQLPDIEPGQVFGMENMENGVYVLTDVKKDLKEPFQRAARRNTGRKSTRKK